jgi:hypothetical protein
MEKITADVDVKKSKAPSFSGGETAWLVAEVKR